MRKPTYTGSIHCDDCPNGLVVVVTTPVREGAPDARRTTTWSRSLKAERVIVLRDDK